ncbi:hypothetical protein QU38_01045, partial [Staphylococcus aureus]
LGRGCTAAAGGAALRSGACGGRPMGRRGADGDRECAGASPRLLQQLRPGRCAAGGGARQHGVPDRQHADRTRQLRRLGLADRLPAQRVADLRRNRHAPHGYRARSGRAAARDACFAALDGAA